MAVYTNRFERVDRPEIRISLASIVSPNRTRPNEWNQSDSLARISSGGALRTKFILQNKVIAIVVLMQPVAHL